MSIWSLPESAKLESQTLDKLALAPWTNIQPSVASKPAARSDAHLPATTNQPAIDYDSLVTNHPFASRLRPLLDDLMREESYLEVRQATNQPGELALAIHLDNERAGVWKTNLGIVLESLPGVQPRPSATGGQNWEVPIAGRTSHVSLFRAGDWTVMVLGPEDTSLTAEVRSRIQGDGAPFPPGGSNGWLHAEGDPARLAAAFGLGWRLPSETPKILLTLFGEDQSFRTRAQLDFPKPLALDLEPWNVPTNLVHDPIASFTAVRGLQYWLKSCPGWSALHLGPPPNQIFLWSQNGTPFLSFFAAPMPEASNRVQQAAAWLLDGANTWLSTNAMGKLARATNSDGVIWTDIPFMEPRLQSVSTSSGPFLFGGLAPAPLTNAPMPHEMLEQMQGKTNLVYYDLEVTYPRSEALIYIDQLLRLIFYKAQLPSQSASVQWLKKAAPKFDCTTQITQTGPAQLSLARRSAVGFTAAELHFLSDWLESPAFPRGLHTFLAPPDPRQKPPGSGKTQALPKK